MQLPNLRPESEHEWGRVVGSEALIEYVAIDRDGRRLSVVVAADD